MAALATSTWNLGFLTVLQEPTGYLGGYLVTNQWGRPIEFRLSTAVQPNRVQQILYGDTLLPYVCGEVIGKTLVDKTAVPAQAIVTDSEAALDLRRQIDAPVAFLKSSRSSHDDGEPQLLHHPFFPADAALLDDLKQRLGAAFDFNEPFTRIREAIVEARKLGVTYRG